MLDLLIVGSGGAGLSAALEAKANNLDVMVVSKTFPTASQTSQAQGGINAVLKNSDDNIQNHINDTLKSAKALADEKAVQYMCNNASHTIQWLDKLGVPFSKNSTNQIAQRSLGGASHPRACYSSDYTGLKILHTLYDNCIKNEIRFLNEQMILNLIVEDNVCCGITVLDLEKGEVKQILSKTVLLASGGYTGIYTTHNTNSTASTGDGIAAAFHAGSTLSNMEYIQFHPTTLQSSNILISESARGEGGYLVTSNEQRFIDELLPRDIVAREIYKKQLENENVYLDLRHLGIEKIKEAMPQEYDIVRDFAQLQLDKDLIPITPAAHYTMGGIKTDINGKTDIQNLYAVGEASCNGVHGANRLGGNSLLEIITFGRSTVNYISKNIENIKDIAHKEYEQLKTDVNNIDKIFDLPCEKNFYHIKEKLGDILYKNVGIFRDEDSLNSALNQIDSLLKDLPQSGLKDKSNVYNTELKDFLELQNMLLLAKLVTISALQRKESRGANYRSDYPNLDEKFEKETLLNIKELK